MIPYCIFCKNRYPRRKMSLLVETPAPRLNQRSLRQMAERHRIAIQASVYKSRLLSTFHKYLTNLVELLTHRTDFPPPELLTIEQNLETIESALTHLWIYFPYNDVLLLPACLSAEEITRLTGIIKETLKTNRHLKLAYSQAA